MRIIIAAALLALAAISCGEAMAASGPEQAAAEFVSAFNSRDPARVAALYTDDAELMPPDSPMVKGQPAIEAFFKAQFEQVRVADVTSLTSAISGRLAFDTGRISITTRTWDQRAETVVGNYLAVFRLVGKQWKMAHHMFNVMATKPDLVGLATSPQMPLM